MRAVLVSMVAAGVVTTATPALACLPPSPPHWPALIGDDAVSIFLGRVDRIETLADEPFGAAVISRARAHVSMVALIQGEPSVTTAEVDGATDIRFTPSSATSPMCLDYLSLDEGDLALVIDGPASGQRRVISAAGAADVPQLAPFIENHR